MNPNMLGILASILSGGAPAAKQQQPVAAQPAFQPAARSAMTPMMSNEYHGGPDVGGFTPGPTVDNGGKGDGKGKGNGKGGRSKFERLEDKIAVKGPKAYTKPIEKNLGINKATVGYGKADPSAFKTGMASILSGVPAPAPAAATPLPAAIQPDPAQQRYPV